MPGEPSRAPAGGNELQKPVQLTRLLTSLSSQTASRTSCPTQNCLCWKMQTSEKGVFVSLWLGALLCKLLRKDHCAGNDQTLLPKVSFNTCGFKF